MAGPPAAEDTASGATGQDRVDMTEATTTGIAGTAQPHRKRGRIFLRLLVYLAGMYVLWCTVLYFYQDRLLFPADLAPDPLPRTDRYDETTAVLKLDIDGGGQVVAWFVPARTTGPDGRSPVAVFFHGNAEIIDFMDDIIAPYREMGVAVLLPELRGYGRSAGSPSERAFLEDAVRFYDEVVKRRDVDPGRIVLHGRSLGGGVACGLAARRPSRALILQSTFTSTADLARRYAAPGFLARHPFHNDRIVPTLDVPVLIAHGRRDEIVPIAHGRALAALARHPTFLEYDCTHNGFPGDGNEEGYWGEIEAFLRRSGVLKGHSQ
jgi:fermentation-respiration switch protein FrsA (DUF1100 family)